MSERMSESKMVVGGMALKRVDLLGIRRRIGAALGQEKLRKYWEILKRYTQFLISKFELDVHAVAVLGAENVPLHNELIRGIFQNALVGTIDPSAEAPSTLGLDELDPRPAKKPKRRVGPSGNIIVAGGAPGNKAAQQWKEAAATQRLTHDQAVWLHQIWLDAHEMHRKQWTICNGADLYDESWELPSVVGLRQKMRKQCQQHSLALAQEAVEGLHKTMEAYVINIIAASLHVAKLRRGHDEAPRPARAGAAAAAGPSIHPEDFLVAMALQPELLGQQGSVHRERLGLLQH